MPTRDTACLTLILIAVQICELLELCAQAPTYLAQELVLREGIWCAPGCLLSTFYLQRLIQGPAITHL